MIVDWSSSVIFRADDQMNAALLRLHMRAHNTVHTVAVCYRDRAQPQARRFLHQFLRMTRAFQKGIVRLAPQRCVRRCVCRSYHRVFILLGTMVLFRSPRGAVVEAWFLALRASWRGTFGPSRAPQRPPPALLPAPNLFLLLEFTLRAPSSPLGSGCTQRIADNCLVWQGGISGRGLRGGYKGWGG